MQLDYWSCTLDLVLEWDYFQEWWWGWLGYLQDVVAVDFDMEKMGKY